MERKSLKILMSISLALLLLSSCAVKQGVQYTNNLRKNSNKLQIISYGDSALKTFKRNGSPNQVIKEGNRFLYWGNRYDTMPGWVMVWTDPFPATTGLLKNTIYGKQFCEDIGDEYSEDLSLYDRMICSVNMPATFFLDSMFPHFYGLTNFFTITNYVKNNRGISNLASPLYISEVKNAMAFAHKKLNHNKKAIDLFKASIGTLETSRMTLKSESGRIGLQKKINKSYENLVNCLIKEKQYNDAFFYVEHMKSRAFIDLLESGKLKSQPNQKYIPNDFKILKLAHNMAYRGVNTETKDLIKKTGEKLQKKTKELTLKHPNIEVVSTAKPITIKEAVEKLGSDTDIIEYFKIDNSYWGAYIHNEQVENIFLCGRVATIDSTLLQLRKELSKITKNRGIYLKEKSIYSKIKKFDKISKDLYNKLIGKHIDIKKVNNKICIVPTGLLYNLPFSSLHSGDYYLIEKHIITYLPSATLARYCYRETNKQLDSVMVLANPDMPKGIPQLPGAEIEGHRIVNTFRPNAIMYHGKRASISKLNNARKYDIIHFATHAYYKPDDPFQSGIILSDELSQSGVLTAEKIFSLNLKKGSLVVNSACETGLSKIISGDELLGLTRGFFFSGATAVISTLWNIDDQVTSDIMTEFYRNLRNSTIVEAMSKAQKSAMNKGMHPLYWAPFIVTGNGDMSG